MTLRLSVSGSPVLMAFRSDRAGGTNVIVVSTSTLAFSPSVGKVRVIRWLARTRDVELIPRAYAHRSISFDTYSG